MSDFYKATQILEYKKVMESVAECAMTEGAKRIALNAMPEENIHRIDILLNQTTDAKNLSAVNGSPQFGNCPDISESAERAVKGAMLNPRELLEIASILSTVDTLKSYSKGKNTDTASLSEIFDRLMTNVTLEQEIKRCIISEDLISDDASPKLADIRRQIRITNNKIRDTLQKYITSESTTKYLRENIVTLRDGRYVIPVKSEHKNDVKGLVHDTSSTGATYFIEPLAVVEANNTLRELEIAEKKEIERILYTLSGQVADFSASLLGDYNDITLLAYIFARAEYSWRTDATCPDISEYGPVILIKARHPLISKDKVVPIDVSVGKGFDCLIITGPNTGGKTVTLKTIGLMSLMAQTGLHIPAGEESKLRVFKKVLADIGDEQSIEQSLSTFSAHMKNISYILDNADEESLVLIDELGAGTDPIEGAALAVSITENIRKKKALTAITTHYSEMKIYALENEGVQNAACEFDINTLSPTFRLILGAPGKSNAFAIASKLGIDQEIIDGAKEKIDPSSKSFENVISRLEEERIKTEKKGEELEVLKKEYREKLLKKDDEIRERLNEAKKAEERANEYAARTIQSAKATSDFIMKELDRAKSAKDKENFSKILEETKANIKRSVKEGLDSIETSEISIVPKDYKLPRPLVEGDNVLIISLGIKGTVAAPADKKNMVSVVSGKMSTKVKENELMLLEAEEIPAKKKRAVSNSATNSLSSPYTISSELDIRGKNGDEAWNDIDPYLDRAIMSGLHSVTLIHGKGTGMLKKRIWEFLKNDKRVKKYRLGNYGEGDGGVTIIEFK
ncbi:MAG: endonuclease MutS2 [Clostridia bacterium]|nr:endonuclease MutS2 [Clostridia bacterium]